MLEISGIGLSAAFAAGIVSFRSPCVLPLVPSYLSYVTGQSIDRSDRPAAGRWPALGLSLCFVLGFSTISILLGASATALGQLLLAYRFELNLGGGAIVIVFCLFLIGIFRLSRLQRELRFDAGFRGGRPGAAYLHGGAFGFAWTPCIGPVLGAILTVSVATSEIKDGVALLAVYSLRLGVPFVGAAVFTQGFLSRLKTLRRTGRALQIGAGAIMVVMGVAMITGDLSAFSYWLLVRFPVRATIG